MTIVKMAAVPVFLILLAGAPAAAPGFEERKLGEWHQWRGPEGSGAAPRGDPPVSFGEGQNVRWKTEVGGEGHASPIVWGGRVYVLSAERTERQLDAPPKQDPRRRTVAPLHYYRFVLSAFDLETGKPVWKKPAVEEVPHEGRHETNSYASASPCTDGERIYASFGSRGVFCFDLEGKELWKRDLGDMRTRLGWGEGASPAVHAGALVVNWDQEEDSFITVLDARTGEPRWRKARDEVSSWATPLVVEHGGRTQVVVNGTNRVRSYDLADGNIIWECGGQTVNAIPSPVRSGETVICMSGYRGAAAFAIPLAGKGDLTGTETVRWSFARGTPYVPSPVLTSGRLWFTQRNSPILTTLDAATGKPLLDGVRVPGLSDLYASPVAAAGKVWFLDRNGTVVVLKDGPTLEVLATNRLEDRFDASPAIVGKKMVLRGAKHLYCLEMATPEKAAEK